MSNAGFEVVANKGMHLVVERESGRCLGGLTVNFYRPFVFPLYTPSGYTVLEAGPPDHPFHTGFFVGQDPVVAGGRRVNYWSVPPRLRIDDPLQERQGRMDAEPPRVEPHGSGVRLVVESVWRDEHEEPVLDEVRSVDFRVVDDATVCDMTSTKTAAYGSLSYPPTKHGSMGIRVETRLLPSLGGVIVGDGNRRGNADVVHEQESAYVAYENEVSGHGQIGVMMSVLADDVPGTWFIRDYGMAMYDSTLRNEITSSEGESWTVALRAVAYEGSLTEERANRWIEGGVAS